jgi:two-component system, response regulator, stage 0 sporulation protein F
MSQIESGMGDEPLPPPCDLFGRGRHVLIAEDDDEMREMLAMTLRRDGFDVMEARNGLELLDKVAPWLSGKEPPTPIDVIVSDVQMPCFTGLEILEGLSEVRRRPAVILITAFGDHRTHATARRFGAAAVFDKPFDLDDLRIVLFNMKDSPGFSGGF